jgi:hypothetical protein
MAHLALNNNESITIVDQVKYYAFIIFTDKIITLFLYHYAIDIKQITCSKESKFVSIKNGRFNYGDRRAVAFFAITKTSQ